MHTDIWYDLTLRALSGEDATTELLRDAKTAQAAAPGEEESVQDDTPAASWCPESEVRQR